MTYYSIDFTQWSYLFNEKINRDDYTLRSQDKDELEKEKGRIVDDIMSSLEDYEIMETLQDIGVGFAVRTYWEEIKDEMKAIVCDDLEMYTALLRCIIRDDLAIDTD